MQRSFFADVRNESDEQIRKEGCVWCEKAYKEKAGIRRPKEE